jgi:hypothetical protein
MRLSVGPVEMTPGFRQAEGRQRQRQLQRYPEQRQRQPQVLRLRSSQVRELPFDYAQGQDDTFWVGRENEQKQGQRQPQIPPLRLCSGCGMTNKGAR